MTFLIFINVFVIGFATKKFDKWNRAGMSVYRTFIWAGTFFTDDFTIQYFQTMFEVFLAKEMDPVRTLFYPNWLMVLEKKIGALSKEKRRVV